MCCFCEIAGQMCRVPNVIVTKIGDPLTFGVLVGIIVRRPLGSVVSLIEIVPTNSRVVEFFDN